MTDRFLICEKPSARGFQDGPLAPRLRRGRGWTGWRDGRVIKLSQIKPGLVGHRTQFIRAKAGEAQIFGISVVWAWQNEAKTKPICVAAGAIRGWGEFVNSLILRGKAGFLGGLRSLGKDRLKLQNEAIAVGAMGFAIRITFGLTRLSIGRSPAATGLANTIENQPRFLNGEIDGPGRTAGTRRGLIQAWWLIFMVMEGAVRARGGGGRIEHSFDCNPLFNVRV